MHFEQFTSNTRGFTPETFAILAKVHEHLLNNPTKESKFKGLDQREKLSMATGISEHAARKAIEFYNGTWDPTKEVTMGQPKRKLEPEYISAVEEAVENINTTGSISTVKKIKKTLDESYDLEVSYQPLLRDLHKLGFKYQKGTAQNILHDKPANVLRRELQKASDFILQEIKDKGRHIRELNDKMNNVSDEHISDITQDLMEGRKLTQDDAYLITGTDPGNMTTACFASEGQKYFDSKIKNYNAKSPEYISSKLAYNANLTSRSVNRFTFSDQHRLEREKMIKKGDALSKNRLERKM